MSVYLTHFTRSSTGVLKYPGASFSCYSFHPRRFYKTGKSSTNHYDVLGVRSDASKKEIKAAFYKLSKKHHPDVNPDDTDAAQKFSTISNAYDILGDPVKRRDYDNESTPSDPYVTYDRTSNYAQRARAHRPSSWKPPRSSSSSYSGGGGGFQGSENAFGSSRNTSYGTFDKDAYDTAFGRFRGPSPQGRSNIYDFDEFYRAHYSDFKSWTMTRKEAQEKMRQNREAEEFKRQQNANRSMASKLSTVAIWVGVGLMVILVSTLLHDMHFRKPVDEFRTKFYLISKSSKEKLDDKSSTKS